MRTLLYWVLRRLGVPDRHKEGFLKGRHYALKIFSDAMFDAQLSLDQQIQIHQFMVAADEQNRKMGTIDWQ